MSCEPGLSRITIRSARFECYYAEAISLPMYSGLTEEQQDEVVTALKFAIAEGSIRFVPEKG